jgi:hypothetical protein
MLRERMQDLNEYEPPRYSSYPREGMTGGVSPFLLGALAGMAVAFLFAPQPGRDTRHWIADKTRRLRRHGEDEMNGEGRDSSGEREYRSRYRDEAMSGGAPGQGQGQGTYGTPGATTTPGSPKSPTSTNPIPTSPTGAARV